MTITTASVIRLALLGLIGGLFQLSVVSQVTIFGVPADLTPLMVASCGFIAGSMTGAVFGFCLGLFIDVSLYQTLGVSSLVFTAVGYGTGRIRELRDPAHGLAPVAVGAAATAIAAVGFTLLQFLLGVQAPGLAAAAARDPADRRAQYADRAARLRDHAPSTAALPARGPASPPAAGLHDRRAQPDLAPLVPQRVEERVRPITPQLAWRVAVLGGIAFVLFGIVFFRLWYLQVLTGQEAVTQARDNRVRKVRIEAPRGDIVDKNNVKLVRTKAAAVVQMVPSQLPDSVREDADTYRKNLAAAENDRLKAQDSYDAFRRQLKDDGQEGHQGREARAERAAQAGQDRAPGPGADRAPGRDRPDRALQAHGPGAADLAQDDPEARDPRDRRRAVLQRHDRHRRAARAVQLHARVRRALQGRRRRGALPAPLPREGARRADLRARVRDRARAAQGGRLRGRRPGHADRPERAREALRQVPARHRRLPARRRRRARAPRRPADRVGARAQAGPAAEADARLQPAEGGRRRRSRRRSRPRTTAPAPAPTWRWTRATARSWRWARSPASTRPCSRARSREKIWECADVARRPASRC